MNSRKPGWSLKTKHGSNSKEMAFLNRGLEIHFRSDWYPKVVAAPEEEYEADDGFEDFDEEPEATQEQPQAEPEKPTKEVSYRFDGGISEFVSTLNSTRAVLHQEPIYVENDVEGTKVEVAMQYNDAFSESVYVFANCINTTDGGTHLTGFRAALTRIINDYAKKQGLIKNGDSNLSGEDTREGLTAIVSVKLTDPQFEGQTKTKLGNPEVRTQVESVVAEGLQIFLEDHPQDARAELDPDAVPIVLCLTRIGHLGIGEQGPHHVLHGHTAQGLLLRLLDRMHDVVPEYCAGQTLRKQRELFSR